jgi:hypothetical protein
VRCALQFLDDIGRRIGRYEEAEPYAEVEPCKPRRIAERRDLRRNLRRLQRGDAIRLHLAGTDVWQRGTQRRDAEIDLATDDIRDRGSGAAIRNVDQRHAAAHLEQFTGNVHCIGVPLPADA